MVHYLQIRWMDGIMNGIYTKKLPTYLFRTWVHDLASKGCRLHVEYDNDHRTYEVRVWEVN